MKQEIKELEKHNTWTVIKRSEAPQGKNVIPGTWALKIKRFPDGRLRKFKERFCVRGDRQVEGVDYFEKWAPTVSWATVRILLCLTLSQGWVTKQVDFSNAFVQATLKEGVYVSLPEGFEMEGGEDPSSSYALNSTKACMDWYKVPCTGSNISETTWRF